MYAIINNIDVYKNNSVLICSIPFKYLYEHVKFTYCSNCTVNPYNKYDLPEYDINININTEIQENFKNSCIFPYNIVLACNIKKHIPNEQYIDFELPENLYIISNQIELYSIMSLYNTKYKTDLDNLNVICTLYVNYDMYEISEFYKLYNSHNSIITSFYNTFGIFHTYEKENNYMYMMHMLTKELLTNKKSVLYNNNNINKAYLTNELIYHICMPRSIWFVFDNKYNIINLREYKIEIFSYLYIMFNILKQYTPYKDFLYEHIGPIIRYMGNIRQYIDFKSIKESFDINNVINQSYVNAILNLYKNISIKFDKNDSDTDVYNKLIKSIN